MSARGQYGYRYGFGNPHVGLGLPHSIGDIEEETKQLHTEMMTFGQELSDQLFRLGDIPKPGVSAAALSLYTKVWRPLMNEWITFHETHHDSFWQNLPFSGAWDRVQDFRTRLLKVREQAKKENFKLQTPDPTPKSDDLDIKKIGLIAGIGFAGLVVLILATRK